MLTTRTVLTTPVIPAAAPTLAGRATTGASKNGNLNKMNLKSYIEYQLQNEIYDHDKILVSKDAPKDDFYEEEEEDVLNQHGLQEILDLELSKKLSNKYLKIKIKRHLKYNDKNIAQVLPNK